MSNTTAGGLDIDLDVRRCDTADIDAWAKLLTLQERARADRFRHADDRRRCIVSRGLLRTMLARRLNRAPVSLVLGVGPHGKPTLDDPGPIAFNVSHSGDYVMVAVGQAAAIGVDVEQVRPDLDLAALGRRVFTPGERASIAGAPEAQKTSWFFRQWVFKEAVAKAVGLGLSLDFMGFEISFSDEAPYLVSRTPDVGRACDWRLSPVTVEARYCAALAVLPWETSSLPKARVPL